MYNQKSVSNNFVFGRNKATVLQPNHADNDRAGNVNKVRYHFDRNFEADLKMFDGIDILQIGDLYCDAGYTVAPHEQWCHEITFVIYGEADFVVNDSSFQLQEGRIGICPKGSVHAIDTKNPLRYAYMGFNIDYTKSRTAEETEFLMQVNNYLKTARDLSIEDGDGLYSVFSLLVDEFYEERAFRDEMIVHLLMTLFVKLLRLGPNNSPKLMSEESLREGVVYQVIRYVEKNHDVVTQIQQIAEELGYSKYYLSHAFKEKTGGTLQEFIVDTRMRKAKELLQTGQHGITEVSNILGYSNLQSFSRSFKQNVGLSPTEFRILADTR